MAANNSLDSFSLSDIDDIKAGMKGLNSDMAVFVLVSRTASNVYDDWDDTRLFLITGGDDPQATEINAGALGLSVDYTDEYLNLSDAAILKAYLDAIEDKYSADEWYLDLWDHGGGWKALPNREIAYDQDSNTAIGMMDVRKALLRLDGSGGIFHFKIVLCDACYMGSLEVASDFEGLCDYFIASPDTIPAQGFPYASFIPALLGETSLADKARSLCAAYGEAYPNSRVSLSALKIDADSSLSSFLSFFSEKIPNANMAALRESRSALSAKAESSVDISVFNASIDGFSSALSGLVAANYASLTDSLNVYFPEYPSYDVNWDSYSANHVHFLSESTAYANFLSAYSQSQTLNVDTLEQNGTPAKVTAIGKGSVDSYIWCAADIDYFSYASDGHDLSIILSPPTEMDYDLRVYLNYGKENEKALVSENVGDAPDSIYLSANDIPSGSSVLIEVYGSGASFSKSAP
jgi:hypothetical protein